MLNSDIQNVFLLGLAFLVLFALAEFLYHVIQLPAEFTRKLVHLFTGFLTLLFPVLLSHHLWVLLLCASFALILWISLRYEWIPSINKIERKSYGSLAYPASVYACFLVYVWMGYAIEFFYVPILLLAVCDPLAAWVGKKWPQGVFYVAGGQKTWSGTFGFFSSAMLLLMIIFTLIPQQGSGLEKIFWSVLIALPTALAEAYVGKGYDNVSIPVVSTLMLWIVKFAL